MKFMLYVKRPLEENFIFLLSFLKICFFLSPYGQKITLFRERQETKFVSFFQKGSIRENYFFFSPGSKYSVLEHFVLIYEKYKGVWYNYKEQTWQAHFVLHHNGYLKSHPLGNFDHPEEAAKAVNVCCQKHNIPHYNPSLPAEHSETQMVKNNLLLRVFIK